MRQFALVMTHHRLWGTILHPYILTGESERQYLKMTDCLALNPDQAILSSLTAEEREVTRLTGEYSDRNLFSLFSRESSVKEFLEKVTPEKISEIIRPNIERKIFKCLEIARDEAIPVYLQKEKMTNLHFDDRLILAGDPALPVFRFERHKDHSTYSLSLDSGGNAISLIKGGTEIICMSPCILRENRNIFFVSDVDGVKLKPFFTRDSIIIPQKTEEKYFAGFVLNAVNNYTVTGSGFRIKEAEPDKEALLTLEVGLQGFPVLILKFRYGTRIIFPDDTAASFTSFRNDNGVFTFLKTTRDFDWEKKCIQFLGELEFYSGDEVNFFIYDNNGDREKNLYGLIEAVNKNYNELLESGFRINTGSVDRKYSLKPVKLEISYQADNDWFDMKATVLIGEWKIPFIKFRRYILDGIREYNLPDGEVAILPETWFTRYRNLFEFGKSSDDILRIHKQHFSLLSDAIGEEEGINDSWLRKLLAPGTITIPAPPQGLRCELRPYQTEGLGWLLHLQSSKLGGCLADDMGLGKTLQILALIQHNKENLKPGKINVSEEIPSLFGAAEARLTSLVVVPATLIYNWETEIGRFTPNLKVFSHKGTQRKRTVDHFGNYDIILSSYHTVRQDIDIISSFRFHYIILDESQVIKNPGSMLYRTISRLKSDFKLVLTGTPVENSLTDLWTQLNFVNPGLLGSLSFFRREFAKPVEKNMDESMEERLKKIIRPFILRRTKNMVARELPAVSEQTIYCDMTEEQMKIYDRERSAVRNIILKKAEKPASENSAIAILQGFMKLRQISNHPLMAYEDYIHGSGKFERVLQDMESIVAGGHKILIFSSFVKHLELYAITLRKERKTFSMLTGASTDRAKIVNSFQNDPSNRIFLISMKAGGIGLNLTAADYVFILDPWWNPAVEMQALNRAHRIGQNKNVFVNRYISSESIEEKIVKLQTRKAQLAETFISSNNPLREMDIEQILEILT